MKYQKKVVTVDAVKLKNKTNLLLDDGTEVDGNAGDWLVESESGEQFILTDEEFKEEYEPYGTKLQPPAKRISVKEALDLYEEQPQQQQRRQPDPYSDMPSVIPVQQTPQIPPPPHVAQKKKKGRNPLGALFGGRKKKKSNNEFKDNNIQIV